MQARLEVRQFPTRAFAALAVAAALVGGGAVGYALKAPTVVSGSTHVVTAPADPPAGQNNCLRLDQRKAC
ncbi:MAG: hypothetical protein WAT58_06270 [Candidatus Dormiibacterota bacterium]